MNCPNCDKEEIEYDERIINNKREGSYHCSICDKHFDICDIANLLDEAKKAIVDNEIAYANGINALSLKLEKAEKKIADWEKLEKIIKILQGE
jgi:transcription elongation factor Elf1